MSERLTGLEISTIKDHAAEILSGAYKEGTDAISVFLQDLDSEYGPSRLRDVARLGYDPIGETEAVTFSTTLKPIGNGYHILISKKDARALGIGPGDNVEVTIKRI